MNRHTSQLVVVHSCIRRLALIVVIFLIAGMTTAQEAPTPPQDHPKLVLVLSGGGARGFAHIGVLRVLEEVVISSGNLAQAMRASMSVPGALPPVMLDGRELVDGGVAANLPIGIAKDLGADTFIGPVIIGYGHSEGGRDRVYFSIGHKF